MVSVQLVIPAERESYLEQQKHIEDQPTTSQERSGAPFEVGRWEPCVGFLISAWGIHHTSWVTFPAVPLYESRGVLAGGEHKKVERDNQD